jgi:hypothetical protein
LGLAFDTKGNNLIVMDSSTGIFELNIDTNKLKIVVLAGAVTYGEPVNIFISLKIIFKFYFSNRHAKQSF